MQAWAPGKGPGQLRSLLGIFQFSGDDVFKKVEVLSGGEKNRLALARLTLDPGNFLLLDEPTNHLDLPTREALEDALAAFGGTLLFVSHDRYFINKVATRVAAFDDGRLRVYDGGYDDYVAALRGGAPARAPRGPSGVAVLPRGGRPAPDAQAGPRHDGTAATVPGAKKREAADGGRPAPTGGGREQRRHDAEARNRRNRELRVFRDRIAALEASILPLETRLQEIETVMSSAETYKEPGLARRLGEEKKSIEIDLAHLYDDWDEATLRDLLARMVAAGGAPVTHGQEVRLRLDAERKQRYIFSFSGGVLVEERAPAISLRATAYDKAGNSSTTSAVPVFGGVRPRGGGARR